MKSKIIIKALWITASIIMLIVLAYALINTMVSYKYEIDESQIWCTSIDISIVAGYMKNTIMILTAFICYLLVNIIYLFFK